VRARPRDDSAAPPVAAGVAVPTTTRPTVEHEMKAFSAILCGGAAIALLTGCVADRGYGYHRDLQRGYYNGAYSGGYYDGYYGPYSGGYWASDGYFYYLDQSRNYRRDDGRHFRRDRFQGGKPIQADDRSHDRDRARDRDRDSRDQQDDRDRRDRNDSDE